MKKYHGIGRCLCIATLALSGCGGGGGSSAPAIVPPFAGQGFWEGSSSTGASIDAVVLETGEFWSVFSFNGTVYGLDHGTVTASGSSYSGNITEYYIPNGSVTPGSISGTFVAQTSLNGVSQFPAASATFSATYSTTYDNPASLSTLTGAYSSVDYNGNPVSVSISASGAISGSSGACTFGGTATPRASGKNVFNIVATFNGGQCILGTATVNGIAVLAINGSVKQVITAALVQDATKGFIWIGHN